MVKELGFKQGAVTTGNSFDHTPTDDAIMAEHGKGESDVSGGKGKREIGGVMKQNGRGGGGGGGSTPPPHYLALPFHTFFFFIVILRRMGKNKALAHHTSMYFHTRRVSI